jgi:hypothetical protein
MYLIDRLTSDGLAYFAVCTLLFLFMVVECVLPLQRPVRLLFARLSLITLTLMLGLRWQTGTDWYPYLDLFQSLSLDIPSLLEVYSYDIGYVFLNAVVRLFSDSYTIFLLINSAIAITLVYFFIRRTSPFPNTSVFIFYNSYFVAHFMGANRRVIAIGFLLLMYCEARRVGVVRFAALLSLAVAFHRSSLVGALRRLVPDRPWSHGQIALLLAASGAASALNIPSWGIEALGGALSNFSDYEIVDKLIFYGQTSEEHLSANVDLFTQSILALSKRALFLAFFLAVRRRLADDPYFARLLNLYIVGIAVYIFFVGAPIFLVLSTYFTVVEIALMGIAAASLNRLLRVILCCLLFPYGVLQLSSAINPYPEEYLPYRWVLTPEYH